MTYTSDGPVPQGLYQVLTTVRIGSDIHIQSDMLTVAVGGHEQNILLYEGWNFISLCCDPGVTDLLSVLGPVWEYCDSVWAYSAETPEWLRCAAHGPPPLNNLTTIEPGKGYYIRMSQDVTLALVGELMIDTSIELEAGWNFVGCNSTDPVLVEEAFLPVECEAIWTYDNLTGEWMVYTPMGPPFMNTLIYLEPGRAYWIYVIGGCIWDINP